MKKGKQIIKDAESIKKEFNKATSCLKIIEPNQNYKVIYSSFYNNKKLTANEIALFIALLSNSNEFKPNYTYLQNRLHIGEKALIKASKGLQEKGYLKIVNNGYNNKVWILSHEPIYLNEYDALPIEPKKAIENLKNGVFNEQQAKASIRAYITRLFAIDNSEQYTQEELMRIIKTKWLD